MPRIHTVLFIVIMLLSSCADDPTKFKSKDIIKKESFIEILIDIHLMDAITNSPAYFREYNQSDSLDLYSNIFSKHDVTKALFDSTVTAYTRRPDLYKEIYDEVLLKLNIRLDKLVESEKEVLKEEVDSLMLEVQGQ